MQFKWEDNSCDIDDVISNSEVNDWSSIGIG